MAEIIDFHAWRQRRVNRGLLRHHSAAVQGSSADYIDVYYGFWDRFDDLTPCDIEGNTPSEQP